MTKMTKTETRRAIEDYRRLVAEQRRLPESEQWTMGERLRRAKARAYVEIECDTFFQR